MNQAKVKSWSVELAIPHVVVLLGLVTGSMALAYYLGMMAGRTVGFQAAQESHLSQLAKLPVIPQNSKSDLEVEQEALASLDMSKLQEETEKLQVPELTQKQLAPIAEADHIDTMLNQREIELEKLAAKNIKTEAKEVKLENNLPAKIESATIVKPQQVEVVKKEKITEAKVETKIEPKIAPKPASISKGWFAQVAAPKAQQDAQALQRKLKAAGFSSQIEQAVVKGETFYRILVGPAESKEKAEKLVARLRGEKLASGQPFIKVVK